MKQSVKVVLSAVGLVIIILSAVFSYNYLTKDAEPEQTVSSVEEATSKPRIEAIDFSVLDIDGNKVSLSDYFSKPVVINFWASWCGPCKSELPAFDSMYKKYGKDVNFLMVNLTDGSRETVEGIKSFIESGGYEFPVYFDTGFEGSNAYNVYSIPFTVLIDKDGHIYKTHTGAMSETTLKNYILTLMGDE